jgi:hypothetical protein
VRRFDFRSQRSAIEYFPAFPSSSTPFPFSIGDPAPLPSCGDSPTTRQKGQILGHLACNCATYIQTSSLRSGSSVPDNHTCFQPNLVVKANRELHFFGATWHRVPLLFHLGIERVLYRIPLTPHSNLLQLQLASHDSLISIIFNLSHSPRP